MQNKEVEYSETKIILETELTQQEVIDLLQIKGNLSWSELIEGLKPLKHLIGRPI